MSQISLVEIDPWDEASALNRSRDRDYSYERGHESTSSQRKEKVWTDEERRQWCIEEQKRLREASKDYRDREEASIEYCRREREKRRTPLW